MKLDSTITTEKQIKWCLMTAGINLGPIDKADISKIEIYGTELSDPGDDYCEYRLFDKDNNLLGTRREMGY